MIEESQQAASYREWGENYARVTGAANIALISTCDLERADNFAARVMAKEGRKAWDGGEVNRALIDGVRRERDFIGAELARRRASRASICGSSLAN
ncbi:hypothetical protein [Acidovorax sp.]|uniref:hypothetical protein n=1 Tax=Acidovorax sp. TaxID=1872122 RepID=UPI00391EE513